MQTIAQKGFCLVFEKLFEKITQSRLYNFFDKHKFFNAQQFGFGEKRLTKSVTTLLISEIVNAMELNRVTSGISMSSLEPLIYKP